jgi:hypothetical protein
VIVGAHAIFAGRAAAGSDGTDRGNADPDHEYRTLPIAQRAPSGQWAAGVMTIIELAFDKPYQAANMLSTAVGCGRLDDESCGAA